MNIKQMSVNYVSEQDRLLLRISTGSAEEIRLWFTRRFTLALLPVLRKSAAEQLSRLAPPVDPAAPLADQRQRLLEQFQKEATAYSGDFKTPYAPPAAGGDASSPPAETPPLLITEVKITLQKTGQMQVQFVEKLPLQNKQVELTVEAQLIQGLLHLLHQAVTQSQWLETPPRLPMLPELPTAEPAAEQEPEGLPLPADRPKYLN